MKKIFIIITALLLLSTGFFVFMQRETKDPLPKPYTFYSEEDEQLFRQVIGKPEGDIDIEDVRYYLDIGQTTYLNTILTEYSIYSEDHKLVIERGEHTNQEVINDIIAGSKLKLFVYNMYNPDNVIDENLIEKIVTSDQPVERTLELNTFISWNDDTIISEIRMQLQEALARGQERGQLPQYHGIKSIQELNSNDWDILNKYWEENIK